MSAPVRPMSESDLAAFAMPCLHEDHFPFQLRFVKDDDEPFAYGVVRTTSEYWDGGGGRTDLHDMFALLWAAVLRSNGVASAYAIGERGFTGAAPELYARTLYFSQIQHLAGDDCNVSGRARLKAHTAWAAHVIHDAVNLEAPGAATPLWTDSPPFIPWLKRLGKIYSLEKGLSVSRQNPDWQYFVDYRNLISIIHVPLRLSDALRACFVHYHPKAVSVGPDFAVVSGGIRNVVGHKAIAKGVRLLSVVEGSSGLPWLGPETTSDQHGIMAVPLENYTLFVGRQSVVAVVSASDSYEFSKVQQSWTEQMRSGSDVFQTEVRWNWAKRLDPGRFEDLARALLDREPGVHWVRSAGQVYEGDAGRDLVALWATPVGFGEVPEGAADEAPSRLRKVLVQAKTRKKTVGKAEVRDVRDTIERHSADGFFLISHPSISADLFNYLETLGKSGTWVSWWGPPEIEDRLRACPDIASLFSDLVRPLKTDE